MLRLVHQNARADRTKTVFTGCALYLQYSESYAWGDLFMQGDRFIFHVAVDECGDISWSRHPQAGQTEQWPFKVPPALTIPLGVDYLLRGGVLVVRASRSFLNAAALAGLNVEVPE